LFGLRSNSDFIVVLTVAGSGKERTAGGIWIDMWLYVVDLCWDNGLLLDSIFTDWHRYRSVLLLLLAQCFKLFLRPL